MELWTWHEAVLNGDMAAARKSCSLVMYGPNGKPVARYHLENAWPAKLEVGGMQGRFQRGADRVGHGRLRAHPAGGAMTMVEPLAGLQTEFKFVLPRGYVDDTGQVHSEGVMRLATARDEIYPQSDYRVRENPAYLSVLLLTRTVTQLGTLSEVDTYVIENLFASDLSFLQELYRKDQPGRPYFGRRHLSRL